MIPLKEAIEQKHRQAERMPFNQLMFSGKLTTNQYGVYLRQLAEIFKVLEAENLPHPALNRSQAIQDDMAELNYLDDVVLGSTVDYVNHLSSLTADKKLAHIYLHYLALMFGGQMMKQKVPGSGNMYVFESMQESLRAIRQLQQDSWADEANTGLDFFIGILDELYTIS